LLQLSDQHTYSTGVSGSAFFASFCESWTMKKEDENILRTFERKIIRRIYGPVRQGREWRIRNNEEIDNIIRKKRYSYVCEGKKGKLGRSRRKNGGQ
jgi:hypothetical protein